MFQRPWRHPALQFERARSPADELAVDDRSMTRRAVGQFDLMFPGRRDGPANH